jgi:hypothetical protein
VVIVLLLMVLLWLLLQLMVVPANELVQRTELGKG